MESTHLCVKPERIRQHVIDLFGYYYVSKADAAMIADNLIDAEIRGVNDPDAHDGLRSGCSDKGHGTRH